MDWIGIVIFILFILFRALGESGKQRKKKEARQQGKPVVNTPKGFPPILPREVSPPVATPDWDAPPIFAFPLLEEASEPKAPAQEVPKKVPEIAEPRWQETQNVIPQVQRQVEEKSPGQLAGVRLEQARQGIIWSEILQPPRALRPHGSDSIRRRYKTKTL